MIKIDKFFDSPANRTGLSIWFGTLITAAVQYFLLHITPPSADMLGLVLGLVKIIQPENAVTVSELQKSIADLSSALSAKTPGNIAALIMDAEQIVDGVVSNPKAP
jgi:hypothetical protein